MTKYIQPELASGGLANAVPTLQPLAEIERPEDAKIPEAPERQSRKA